VAHAHEQQRNVIRGQRMIDLAAKHERRPWLDRLGKEVLGSNIGLAIGNDVGG